MGFITLAVLLLPRGVGGCVNRAETSPGQVVTAASGFHRSTKDAMILLWGIYLALNVLQVAR